MPLAKAAVDGITLASGEVVSREKLELLGAKETPDAAQVDTLIAEMKAGEDSSRAETALRRVIGGY